MEIVDIEKLKTKSALQLFNYMEKRRISSFSEELKNYYYFRQHFLGREYSIRRKIKRLGNKKIIADNSITRDAARTDYNKMQDDLKWIMEGFFELSENEQMNPPKKDFF